MAKLPIIKFPDGSTIDVVDPAEIAPVYTDLLTEIREVDGVVYLSFASFVIDGDGEDGRKARVVSRLRMSKHRAAMLYGLIGNMLASEKAPEGAVN